MVINLGMTFCMVFGGDTMNAGSMVQAFVPGFALGFALSSIIAGIVHVFYLFKIISRSS